MGDDSRISRPFSWLFAAGLGVVAGACSISGFACEDDQQCLDGGAEGICQPTGWCSFDDTSCPSSQRYGEHAEGRLSGACVPVWGEGSGGASGGDAADETGTNDDPGLDGTTTDGMASGTGDVTGDIGDPFTPDLGSPGDSSGGDPTGGAVEPSCAPVIIDDFDDGAIDLHWYTWSHPATEVEETGSALRFSLVADAQAGMDTGITSVDTFDFSEGHVRVELGAVPPSGSNLRLNFQLWTSDLCSIWVSILEDGVVQTSGGESNDYDPDIQWVQLRFEGMLGHVEGSLDGITWDSMAPPIPITCDLTDASVILFGGPGGDCAAGPSTSAQSIEVCASPLGRGV